MNEIHVCFSTDNHYAPYCGAAILSMLQNKAPEDPISIYILHQSLSADNQEKLASLGRPFSCSVRLIRLGDDEFRHFPLAAGMHLTVETYFRLAIPRLFPEAQKIIYLDCDILVKGSLKELFDIDTGKRPLGMTLEVTASSETYNSGVILYNCDIWRQEQLEATAYAYIQRNRETLTFPDQDTINAVLKGRIYTLDTKWNKQIPLLSSQRGDPSAFWSLQAGDIVIHFIGECKPWHGLADNAAVEEYMQLARLLPWEVPDLRSRYQDCDIYSYYRYKKMLRSVLDASMIQPASPFLCLFFDSIPIEIALAAADLGLSYASFGLITQTDLAVHDKGFIIVEAPNILIADDMIKRFGYCLRSDYIIFSTMEREKASREEIIREYQAFLAQ